MKAEASHELWAITRERSCTCGHAGKRHSAHGPCNAIDCYCRRFDVRAIPASESARDIDALTSAYLAAQEAARAANLRLREAGDAMMAAQCALEFERTERGRKLCTLGQGHDGDCGPHPLF